MNKYQETMSHIKVDDEMKKRVLQNVQENLDKEKALSDRSEKIIYFKRLGTMAAMFAAAIIGVTAVVKFTGGINSNSPSFDAAPSFEMEATDSVADEAAEDAVVEEATESVDSMGRSDANDSLEMEDSFSGNALTENANRTENYAKDYAVGESVTNAEPAVEEAAQEISESEEVSTESSSNIKVIVIVIIILLIATILGFIYWRKKKNQL